MSDTAAEGEKRLKIGVGAVRAALPDGDIFSYFELGVCVAWQGRYSALQNWM
jgi:hypothetical protein